MKRFLSLRSIASVPYDELNTWSIYAFQVKCWSTCTPNSFVHEIRLSGVSPQAIGSFRSSKLWYRAICGVEMSIQFVLEEFKTRLQLLE